MDDDVYRLYRQRFFDRLSEGDNEAALDCLLVDKGNLWHGAVQNDDKELFEHASKVHGFSLQDSESSNTPFIHAIGLGKTELVQWMVEQGADPNQPTNRPNYEWHGERPLHLATHNAEMTKCLIDSGADPNLGNPNLGNIYGQSTPIQYASRYGHIDTIQTLLENGADPSQQDNFGANALSWALYREDDDQNKIQEVFDVLKEHNTEFSVVNRMGNTLAHVAADKGLAECLHYVLNQGVHPADKNSLGQTALFMAVRNQHPDCIDTIARRSQGLPTVNQPDINGNTPLHEAVKRCQGDMSSIETLLKYGADINAQNPDGDTPLILAAREEKIEVCNFLVQNGADRNVLNNMQQSAESLLRERGHDQNLVTSLGQRERLEEGIRQDTTISEPDDGPSPKRRM